jgi:predicted TIM-barrel fold metal-dependent hydrolase
MIGGFTVFDNVIHAYDMSDANLRPDVPSAEISRAHMTGDFVPNARVAERAALRRRWDPESLYRLVFEDGLTDYAMAQVVPIYDWYKDWFAPVQAQYEMARAYPERVLFCGGADPNLEGVEAACDHIEQQVTELGARSMKFYNGHIDRSWDCSDPEVAYPMYQKCLDLGVDVIQFHKGIPFGVQNMETLRPNDLQGAARDFPAMNFIIHHLSWPYFEETISIAARFPNVYLALSGTVARFFTAPRRMQEMVGRLLAEVGSSKLMWGSESPLVGPPRPYLEAFLALQIADDLQEGYGYPQLTDADRRAILGGTFAGLMRVDLAAKQPLLAGRAS